MILSKRLSAATLIVALIISTTTSGICAATRPKSQIEEALHYAGQQIDGSIESTQEETCPYCKGEGRLVCSICRGTGRCPPCGGNGGCTLCRGTGNCQTCGGSAKCLLCKGQGGRSFPKPGGGTTWLECSACHGSGVCSLCRGTGACHDCNGSAACQNCGGTGVCGVCEGEGGQKCSFCGGTGKAPDLSITVSTKYGQADQIFSDGRQEPITVSKIRDEIKIVTHKNSFVEYWISDYFRIRQGEKTLFEFKEVKLIEGKLLSLLHWGTMYGHIKKDGKIIKQWLIRTPAALVKTSQTEFVLEVAENGATTLTVLTGEVDLSDLSMNKTVTVKQNEKSTVQPGGTPSQPEPASPNKIERWWEITEITETTETTEATEITEATETAETTEATETTEVTETTEETETTESTSTPQEFAEDNHTWLAVVATAALAALIAAIIARKKLGSSKADRSNSSSP